MAGSSVPKIKNICVFGGSSLGKEKSFLESANHLGRVLAERKIHLVYGGGSLGLMGGCFNSCIFRRQSSFGGRPQSFSRRGHHWKNSWKGTTGLHNV
jgi:predicted Rossmann-fold nucleotide-binding protein